MMKARAHIIVSGNVHGVFFRSSTRSMASLMGLKGWVRNTSDGRVEAVFEGDKEDILKIIEFCSRGPPGAHVDDMSVEWEDYKGKFSGFEIRY